MDARSSRFASQFSRLFAVAAVALLLVGCDVKVIDRTPPTFTANPSGVYTITAEIRARPVVRAGTLKPTVVIDGSLYPMQPSQLGGNLWEFDYRMPPGRNEAKYYILVNYDVSNGNTVQHLQAYTGLTTLTVSNRYSLSLDASRAPVGAQVTVLGRGFTSGDVVYVGSQPAETIYRSENSLSFIVPSIPAGRNYMVTVGTPGSGLDVGTLRVDQGSLTVTPSGPVRLASGQRRQLVFSIPTPAPDGGLLLDVTTDIPDSVIMPEVRIPAGASSVNVAVEGGRAGSGSLWVSAAGFGETSIPITVTAN